VNCNIDLTADDVHDLVEVIEYRLHELQIELVHTDDRHYRQELREASRRLEDLRERVHHLREELPARPEPSPLAFRPTPA
jgi:hypothetical protein